MPSTQLLASLSLVLHVVAFGAVVWLWIRQMQIMGPWHGLLGLVSCFLYPFIWGCMKAKQYELTRTVQIAAITSLVGFFCGLPSLFERLPLIIETTHRLMGLPSPY
jgi:hypothetical protein